MTAKKTAKKRTATAVAKLPKGFQAIGGFGTTFPDEKTKKGTAIQGVVTGYKEDITTPHGKTSNLTIESKDGTNYTVWHSAGLTALFDEDYTDIEVWIRFDGMGKKSGKKNAPKLFTLAINE